MTSYEELRERVLSLPEALTPVFDHGAPNEPITLYRGPFFLNTGDSRVECDGVFKFEWFPSPRVRFEGEAKGLVGDLFNLGSAALEIPDLNATTNVILSHLELSFESRTTPIVGFISETTWVGEPTSFDSVTFHLPNFHKFRGAPIRYTPDDETLSSGSSRLEIEEAPWRVTLDQYHDYSDRRSEVRHGGGFVLGHVGRIERTDDVRLNRDEADDMLMVLHYFFSFCRGFWCGPILAAAGDAGDPAALRWHSPLLSQWKGVSSWFPELDLAAIGDLFSGFVRHWEDDLWQEALRHTTNWYVESNLNAGMLEGSISLAQTALEHLSWVYLVEDQELFSTGDLKDKKTAEKFRLLLSELDIPIDVPDDPTLAGAVDLLETESLKVEDGPDLLVKVRNMIVHPRRAKRERLSRLSSEQKYQVKQLGLLYIELLTLRLLGYSGPYYSRLERGSIQNRKSITPWSS